MASNALALPDAGENIDNSVNWINARHQGIVDAGLSRNNALALRNDATNQQAGNALADDPDNLDAVRDIYARGGRPDLAFDVQDRIKKTSNEELADHALKNQKLSAAVQEANDFDHIDQVSAAAKLAGYNTGQYAPLIDKYRNVPGGLDVVKKTILADTGQLQTHLEGVAKQRAENQKTLGQIALSSKGDDDEFVNGLLAAGRSGIPVAHLLQQGENGGYALAPGARALVEGQGGQGTTVFNADAKAQLFANKAAKQSALGQATENVIQGALKRFPGATREDIPLDIAQAAAAARGTLEQQQDGTWMLRNPDGSVGALRQQFIDNQKKRYDPAVTAANAYAREGSKQNVKLDAQINRLEPVKDQIQQLRDMAGGDGTPERKDFEHSIGWLTSHSGKQYWSGALPFTEVGNVPAIMFNLKGKIHTLQDELAQYVQTGGNSSDVRARNAYEVVGDLQNSPDVPTFMKRLKAIEDTVESIKKAPHIDAASGGPKAKAAAPAQAPLAPGRYKYNPTTGEIE